MKTTNILRPVCSILACLLLTLSCWSAESDTLTVNFANMPSEIVLRIYKDYAKCELVESPELKKHHSNISLQFTGTASEVQKQIEKALTEQAGIVITRLDDKRVSVTFDASLPIKPAVRKNPAKAKIVN